MSGLEYIIGFYQQHWVIGLSMLTSFIPPLVGFPRWFRLQPFQKQLALFFLIYFLWQLMADFYHVFTHSGGLFFNHFTPLVEIMIWAGVFYYLFQKPKLGRVSLVVFAGYLGYSIVFGAIFYHTAWFPTLTKVLGQILLLAYAFGFFFLFPRIYDVRGAEGIPFIYVILTFASYALTLIVSDVFIYWIPETSTNSFVLINRVKAIAHIPLNGAVVYSLWKGSYSMNRLS